jgi:hypothetical protein
MRGAGCDDPNQVPAVKADDRPRRGEPTIERPSYWPYEGEEHKRLIEMEIRLLLALETYEKQVWGDAWPPPLTRDHARWRRELSRKLWGDEPRPGHQYGIPIHSRELPDRRRTR